MCFFQLLVSPGLLSRKELKFYQRLFPLKDLLRKWWAFCLWNRLCDELHLLIYTCWTIPVFLCESHLDHGGEFLYVCSTRRLVCDFLLYFLSFFFCCVFVWFWNQDNRGFIKIWKFSIIWRMLVLVFLRILHQIHLHLGWFQFRDF